MCLGSRGPTGCYNDCPLLRPKPGGASAASSSSGPDDQHDSGVGGTPARGVDDVAVAVAVAAATIAVVGVETERGRGCPGLSSSGLLWLCFTVASHALAQRSRH